VTAAVTFSGAPVTSGTEPLIYIVANPKFTFLAQGPIPHQYKPGFFFTVIIFENTVRITASLGLIV